MTDHDAEPLDRLAATSPDLLTALYALIDNYGLLGVQRTLTAIVNDYGQEPTDD
jgi:hypothetical protein